MSVPSPIKAVLQSNFSSASSLARASEKSWRVGEELARREHRDWLHPTTLLILDLRA
jgi:hypothetical protein